MNGQEPKKLYRPLRDRKIAGVCSGVAEYLNIDPTVIRLAAVAAGCLTGGIVLVAYIIAAFIIPEAPTV